jgi:hypothetical protein
VDLERIILIVQLLLKKLRRQDRRRSFSLVMGFTYGTIRIIATTLPRMAAWEPSIGS